MNYLIQSLVPLNTYFSSLFKSLTQKPVGRKVKSQEINNNLSSEILNNIITMQADNFYGRTIVK